MKDSELTEKQAAELLRRLGTDEEFRGLFESKPAKALFSMGVPAETIVNLPAACLCATPLASMADLKAASDKMDAAVLQATASMGAPKIS
jgi:putative modified peptide